MKDKNSRRRRLILHRLSHESLQILCLDNGLSIQGTIAELIERLETYEPDASYISSSSSSSENESTPTVSHFSK